MKLVTALGLDVQQLPRPGTPKFTDELKRRFSNRYPSLITGEPKGYQPLPRTFPSRTKMAMARLGLEYMGLLELLSEDDILRPRPSGKQTDLGVTARDRVKDLLQKNGKRLRAPSVTYTEVATASFGHARFVPVEWLIFEEALPLGECIELREWGFRCLGDTCKVPWSTLTLLPGMGELRLRKIREVIHGMGLRMT